MGNVVIIGKGPAGIATALYTQRANVQTTIIGKDFGAVGRAHLVENFYGQSSPISGEQLAKNAVDSAIQLGCELVDDEVTSLTFDGKNYNVITTKSTYTASTVVIATGASRSAPRINGIKEFDGKGVSYCAICDAFFYKGKDVCIIGDGEYAVHEASVLKQVANSVKILTNGKELKADNKDGCEVINAKISAITGDEANTGVSGVSFEDGSSIDVYGVFVAIGVASSNDLCSQLGVALEGNKIKVNENMQTNLPRLYAVGDCVGGLYQISKAVHEGAKAGIAIGKNKGE